MKDVTCDTVSLTEEALEGNLQHALDLADHNHVIITNEEQTPLYVILSIDEFDRLKQLSRNSHC